MKAACQRFAPALYLAVSFAVFTCVFIQESAEILVAEGAVFALNGAENAFPVQFLHSQFHLLSGHGHVIDHFIADGHIAACTGNYAVKAVFQQRCQHSGVSSRAEKDQIALPLRSPDRVKGALRRLVGAGHCQRSVYVKKYKFRTHYSDRPSLYNPVTQHDIAGSLNILPRTLRFLSLDQFQEKPRRLRSAAFLEELYCRQLGL